MALLDGGAERSAEEEPSVLKNPTILVVQDFLVVLARRVSAARRSKFKLPTRRKGKAGAPQGNLADNPRIIESTLVSAWLPLEVRISLYLPISPPISPPRQRVAPPRGAHISPYLPMSPRISPYLPVSPHISQGEAVMRPTRC